MVKIMLDAGHDINTPGKRALDGSMREFEFNKNVSLKAGHLLNQYEGVEVVFSHNMDDGVDQTLSQRTNLANQLKVDSFISIHANAGPTSARGIETFIYPKAGESTYNLARAIHDHTIINTGMVNRSVKRADFHVLRETNMHAVLIECGFMTNTQDLALLKDDGYRGKCAEGIVRGLAQFYGLKKKYVAPPAPQPAPQPVVTNGHVHRVIVDGVQVGAFDSADGIANLVKQHVEKNVKKIEIVLV